MTIEDRIIWMGFFMGYWFIIVGIAFLIERKKHGQS